MSRRQALQPLVRFEKTAVRGWGLGAGLREGFLSLLGAPPQAVKSFAKGRAAHNLDAAETALEGALRNAERAGVKMPKPPPEGLGRVSSFVGKHPGVSVMGAGGLAYLLGRNNQGNSMNPSFQPTVYKVGMEKAALSPLAQKLLLLGGGAAGGAGISHALTRRHWEPVNVGVAHPQTGEYAGDVIGPRDAVSDWQEAMEEAEDYDAINQAMSEADARSVVFRGKTASMTTDDRTPGQMVAHTFLSTLSKIGESHAEKLYREGHLSKEATQQFREGVFDITKLSRLIVADATLDAAV